MNREPWKVGNAADCARDHAICAGPVVVARVVGRGYPTGSGWSPGSAEDALLMAAAPELLAALRELQRQVHEHVKFNVRKHYSLMIADAAANKAIERTRL